MPSPIEVSPNTLPGTQTEDVSKMDTFPQELFPGIKNWRFSIRKLLRERNKIMLKNYVCLGHSFSLKVGL